MNRKVTVLCTPVHFPILVLNQCMNRQILTTQNAKGNAFVFLLLPEVKRFFF